MRNAMSIDVEDWFHPEALRQHVQREDWDRLEPRAGRVVDELLRMLDAARVRATFFVLGWVAEREPDLVPRLVRAGHEVASHGYAHRMITQQTPEEFAADLRRSLAVLRSQSGTAVRGYRAPSFSVVRDTLWALDILLGEGIEYDSSIFPVRHDRYGMPGAARTPGLVQAPSGRQIVEFPMSTAQAGPLRIPVSGGGYFRLLPYWFTRRGLRSINEREGMPFTFYLHPWEIDAAQPRVQVKWLSRFRHYTNLSKCEGRLRRLLTEFRFTTMRKVLRARGLLSC